jgi:hypothetical protein
MRFLRSTEGKIGRGTVKGEGEEREKEHEDKLIYNRIRWYRHIF